MRTKRRIVLLTALSLIAVPTFGSGTAEVRGCQAFGHATANGAPWGVSNQGATGPDQTPGQIASNTLGEDGHGICSS
jgi:hypothetical protein